MSDIPNMIVITGPTATGRTALGVAVAKAVDGEVIGADSMQIYRYMDIGTAKPTPAEMDGVPHHMVDIIDPAENYSVSRYVEQATAVADDILARGKVPVVVGGTGLYIDSLVAGREFAENQSDPKLRSMLEQQYDEHGGEAMRAMLHSFDPDRAEKLHPADKRRIVRAIEVYLLSGDTITAHDERTKAVPKRYNAVTYALDFTDRADLYRRIDLRVDRMMDAGLLAEAETVFANRARFKTAAQAIGYKEFFPYFMGESELTPCVEKLKQASRNYAKRQLTWFRHMDGVVWLDAAAPDLKAHAAALTQEFITKG